MCKHFALSEKGCTFETSNRRRALKTKIMARAIHFSFPYTMESIHPDFQVTATFSGTAVVGPDNVDIKNCRVTWDGYLGVPEIVSVEPGPLDSQQNRFLGMCREAARVAYEKQVANDREIGRQSNGGFVPRASDTKYMNSDHE